jgi:hypothetical protein
VAGGVERILQANRRHLPKTEDLVRVNGRVPVDREEVAGGHAPEQVVGEQRDDDRQPVLDQAPDRVLPVSYREGEHQADDPDEDPVLRVGEADPVIATAVPSR